MADSGLLFSHPWKTEGSVPRLAYNDPRALELISKLEPVVLTGCNLTKSAVNRWTPEHLAAHVNPNAKFSVFISKNQYFRYWDFKQLGNFTGDFTPPTECPQMTFGDFMKLFLNRPDNKYFYLQQALEANIGESMQRDFNAFDFAWLATIKQTMNWNELTSNLLLVGNAGVVTPLHYDEQENLFAQLVGTKRFYLFSPDQYGCLYPYPVHHPHDRQSQIDFDAVDWNRFPRFREAKALEAVLEPGDLLYLPLNWWHHVESLTDTVSVNFWFKASPIHTQVKFPLSTHQLVSVRRNIEKMLNASVGPDLVGTILGDLYLGRFDKSKSDNNKTTANKSDNTLTLSR